MSKQYIIQEDNGQLQAIRAHDGELLGYIEGTNHKQYKALQLQIERYGWKERQ